MNFLQVCNTYAENQVDKARSRRRRAAAVETGYYEKETMFTLSVTRASIYNSAPVLDSGTEVDIMEDSGNTNV